MKLLQTRLRYFYPLKPDLANVAADLAGAIEGALTQPPLSRKLRFLTGIVGWESAMRLKNALWIANVVCRKNWDMFLEAICELRSVVAPGPRR